MKNFVYISLVAYLLITGCKRQRKINVEGIVTDIYTGQPAPNVPIKLYSQIEVGVSGGTTNKYETTTDAAGHYKINNAVFSKPGNQGWIEIPDSPYELVDLDVSDKTISGKEIKFIGKTNLTKNIAIIGLSDLNLSLNFSPSIQVTGVSFYRKFSSNIPLPNRYTEFSYFGGWPAYENSHLPNKLIGYTDGKNIIKTEYYYSNTQTTKTKYDTIISLGCGTVNNYTITLN
ncbi:MAG: hypothetical protein HY062_12265 [Bacteroidetes bacterium]|nr:hypothetical protein [Bacteroidota bacterium]